jgi:hypothetical protein
MILIVIKISVKKTFEIVSHFLWMYAIGIQCFSDIYQTSSI